MLVLYVQKMAAYLDTDISRKSKEEIVEFMQSSVRELMQHIVATPHRDSFSLIPPHAGN